MNTLCEIDVNRVYKSKLESEYAQVLEIRRLGGDIQWWKYEPIKLRLADGAWYTPDFMYLDSGGQIHIHETKGFWREAAKVRIKVAASLYPLFRFTAVMRVKGHWEHEGF